MKYLIIIIFFFATLNIQAQTTENGVVKEYHGKEAKTNLSGVELMVKGAPSTVSDAKGAFALRFSTLKPGDKVDYSEIYKDGYVIFNKDALDTWRISGNGSAFTIIMCRESDFRALKKKFYGIIEKSYKTEYLKQKDLAEQNIANVIELNKKLKELENDYNEKLGNINTYVELFARIDRSEMDSVEAKALHFVEIGDIDRAIEAYEELQLSRQVHGQIDKWDAGVAMVVAGNNMIEQVKTDLMALVEKMQKQITLYEIGGYSYDVKKYEAIDVLIKLLYKLVPVSGTKYNELLGKLLVDTSKRKPLSKRNLLEESASIPSIIGLVSLADFLLLDEPCEELLDTINGCYSKALQLINNRYDSISTLINLKLNQMPDGYFLHSDGIKYPYKIIAENKAKLIAPSPYYTTKLGLENKLPDYIMHNDSIYNIISIGKNAFKCTYGCSKIELPNYCEYLEPKAIGGSSIDNIEIIINRNLKSIFKDGELRSFPQNSNLVFKDTPRHIEWIIDYCQAHTNDTIVDISSSLIAIANFYKKNGLNEEAFICYENLVMLHLHNDQISKAEKYATESALISNKKSHYLKSLCYEARNNIIKAINECKKSLPTDNGKIYNHIGYLFSKCEPKADFNKAHKSIDKAISLAKADSERADYYDSKGEVYLMQNDELMAREFMNKAISADSTFYVEHKSNLYNHFNPSFKEENNLRRDNEKIYFTLQLRRNLAITLMALDYSKSFISNWSEKKEEAMKMSFKTYWNALYATKENSFYSSYSYEVFNNFYKLYQYQFEKNNHLSYKLYEEISCGFDCLTKQVVDCIFGALCLKQFLPCCEVFENDLKQINHIYSLYNQSLTTLTSQKREMFEDFITKKNILSLPNKYSCSIDSIIGFVKQHATYIAEMSQNIDFGDDDSLYFNENYDSFSSSKYTEEIDEILSKKGRGGARF